MPTCVDGFSLAMSPLAWAAVCEEGDLYSYYARRMDKLMPAELAALCATCARRGLTLVPSDRGLRVVATKRAAQAPILTPKRTRRKLAAAHRASVLRDGLYPDGPHSAPSPLYCTCELAARYLRASDDCRYF